MSKRYVRFVELLNDNPDMSNSEMAEILGITDRQVRRYRTKQGVYKGDEYVYLLHCEGYYKIGRARDVNKRVDALNIGTPFEISVVSKYLPTEATASKVESGIHRALQPYNVKGEWFLFDFENVSSRFEELANLCDTP